MNFQTNQMQLPVDPTRMMMQPFQVVMGNPHFLPQVGLHPGIADYLPLITTAAISEIQANAGKNPLRMFMYNMFGQNHFNNQQFAELVQMIGDVATLRLMQGGVDVNSAISQAVTTCCQGFASAALFNYQALGQYLNPQQIQEANKAAGSMSYLQQQIQNAQNQSRGAMPMGGGMMMGGMQGMGMQQAQPARWNAMQQNSPFSQPQKTMDSPVNTRWDHPPRQTQPQQQTVTNRFSNNATTDRPTRWSLPTNDQVQQPAQSGGWRQSNKSFNSDAIVGVASSSVSAVDLPDHNFNQQPMSSQNQQAQQPVASEITKTNVIDKNKLYEFGELKWKPTDKQPYIPAYNPKTHRPYMKVDDENNVIVVLKKIREGDTVDPDKHAIGRTHRNTSRFIPSNKSEVEKEKIVNMPEPELTKFKLSFSDSIPVTVSEDSSIYESRIESIFAGKLDDIDSAAMTTFQIHTPIAAQYFDENGACDTEGSIELAKKYGEFVNAIANATTFEKAVDVLKMHDSKDFSQIYDIVNTKLTEAVNHFLSTEMMLTLKIDDFVDDAMVLDAELRKRHGHRIAETLKFSEDDIITKTISLSDRAELYQIIANITGKEDLDLLKADCIVSLTHSVSLTHINLNACDLNISFPNKVSMLTPELTPALYSIASDILKNNTQHVELNKANYIVTRDKVKIEIVVGALNKDLIIARLES